MNELLPTPAIATTLREEWHGLPPSTRLPSDRVLAERFDVGHGVVARIMGELEREGLVRRQRGAGTFWLGLTQTTRPRTLPSFSRAMREAGVEPGFELIGQGTRRVTAVEREHLRLPANSLVWRIQRVFSVEGVRVGFATSVLPARDLNGLPSELESYGSLFEALRRRYHRDARRAWQRRRPTESPRFVCEALGLRGPTPVRLEESLNRAEDGTPLEYARTYMRTDDLSTDDLIRRAGGRRPARQEASRR